MHWFSWVRPDKYYYGYDIKMHCAQILGQQDLYTHSVVTINNVLTINYAIAVLNNRLVTSFLLHDLD